MRIDRRWYLVIAAVVLFLVVGMAWSDDDRDDITLRWDIVHLSTFTPLTFFAGGSASALAQDGSKITLTGSGTFQPGESDDVTGGGTWQTFNSAGVSTGTGTYKVRRLIRFEGAPGVPRSTTVDHIGDGTLKDVRAGLVFLRVSYSDGSKGVLVVSCGLSGNPPPTPPPDATPASVFEGVTASKGFVDYWNHVGPVGGVDGGRTLFHVVPHQEKDEG
jgi:hypothetical protein